MYDVHSKEFKKKFVKSKYEIKQWEKEFTKKNGRPPARDDIKASSKKIKEYYKLYYNLKTRLLDAEILGMSTPGPEVSQKSEVNETEKMLIESDVNVNKDVLNNSLEEKKVENLKENITPKPQTTENENSWGDHLNKSANRSVINVKLDDSSSRITQKLFEGSKFKKRNPRKSVSFQKNKSNMSIMSCEDANSSIDLNNDSNLNLTMESFDESLQVPDASPSPDSIESSLEQMFSVENDCSPKIKALITSKTAISPLFSSTDKVKIISHTSKTNHRSVNLISRLVAEPSKVLDSIKKVDVKWLDRCCADVSKTRLSSDSGFGSLGSSPQLFGTEVLGCSQVNSQSNGGGDDDDDDEDEDELICGSDNELDESIKSRFSFGLSQKRKSEIFETSLNTASTSLSPINDSEKQDVHMTKKAKMDTCIEVKIPEIEEKSYELKTNSVLKKEKLEKKIKAGTLNENYLKINIKKKVFVRGKKNFNYSKHKKQQWKKKKKDMANDSRDVGSMLECFKCGEVGHFARYCQKVFRDKLLSDDENDIDDEDGLPTLEEAENLAKEAANKLQMKKKNVLTVPAQPEQEEDALARLGGVQALYPTNEDGSLIETPKDVYDTLNKFGHYKFRPGQEEAVMRILSGKSTLVTVSTGGGKSLCYQLPAYLYAQRSTCITLVVSPLVSLMEDQVSISSSFFKAGCLHANQTPKQREQILDDIKSGKIFALLVSPETLTSRDNSPGLGAILKQLPPIAFACIDEVHCVSQWSHNFRPSYLMICNILREKMGIQTILGLTATANKTTIAGVVKELGVSDTSGVIKDNPLPENLCLSISKDEYKDDALIKLLGTPRFKDSNSTIIYCTRRDECERIAGLIRTKLNYLPAPEKPNKRLSYNAESYHAGMSSSRRKQIQKSFMAGNLRIVVATVAFGMGINKKDIRAVIHYNMPKDFESYVQEVGRAGRDGELAHCHLFLDAKGRDQSELKRHIYSNSVDRHVIRRLLQRVFVPCKCSSNNTTCPGHEVAFDCNETIQALDIPEENISTLLCYLELHPKKLIKVLTPAYINCQVQSYKGVKGMNDAAKKCAPLAVACALNGKAEANIKFDIINLARVINWDSGVIKSQLKNLEWCLTKDDKWKKTGMIVDFAGLGFRVCSRGDMSAAELDDALSYLIERVENQEKRASSQLNTVYSALTHFSVPSFRDCSRDYDKTKSDQLKEVIRKYFETDELSSDVPLLTLQDEDFDEALVASDVRSLVCTYSDNNFNGRAVARIFHGIQSPNYPSISWSRCPFWRRHLDKDFNRITRIATIEILRLK